MITDKENAFAVILSEFKEESPEFEASFDQYNDYQNTLKNDNEENEQCLEFYQCFPEFHVKYPSDFKRAYQCSVVKFKLKKLKNEPSISNYIWSFFIIKLWLKKDDEVVIRENVNNIDKRFKEDKITEINTWDFGIFPYGRDYKYGWKQNGSTEELSLKYPVPGCKFVGFSKIFDLYKPVLKERLITNNGNHDAVLSPN